MASTGPSSSAAAPSMSPDSSRYVPGIYPPPTAAAAAASYGYGGMGGYYTAAPGAPYTYEPMTYAAAAAGAPGVPYPTYEYPPAAYPQPEYDYVGSYPYGTGATATTWPDDPAAQYAATLQREAKKKKKGCC
ncbi:unnamed protein product [Vitrella brassicaformis CCMP3155]|uniref:Uncharacterized protein n=2 Tax=Vitrella brassicaformis TaxID=1169539 RepID=A0A0G4EDW0_VITBC|nr:unnamed protein product [Vitrella brassicaformis CCMP3155]|eukprot:CEL93929.1 unnamed protein product [Vitrella brassicaformis CCMP3155]